MKNLENIYQAYLESGQVTTDSRVCPEGSVFFALKGESFDGNQYAAKALESGCAYVVVDDPLVVAGEQYFLVEDVLLALQAVANYHRKQLALPIIGITGSNGKTTTKELLATALATEFNLHFTQGNFNNHIGVPLTLLQLKKEHEIAIVEMGANHPFEIGELCKIADPDMGIITNIGKAHLEGFGGIEGVIKTKKELYDYIAEKGGQVFVNGADELLMSLSEGMNRVLYNAEDALFDVKIQEAIPTLTLKVTAKGNLDELKLQLVGEYNVINISVALELGAHLGANYCSMKEALEAYVPSNNRSQIVQTKANKVILDAYNANPASMGVAVANFSKLDMPHKAIFLGAMKEMGEYSKEEHQVLVDKVSEGAYDLVVLVGEEFGEIDNKPEDFLFMRELAEVKQYLKRNSFSDSIVLVKGSRSMKMEELVELL